MIAQAHQKIRKDHLEGMAYLYVRQSTLQQVRRHQESTQRQYALQRKAEELGWPPGRIVVIDCDLGQSGASAKDREGFQRLVAEVGMGHAGVVLGLEVSRLARNNSDWHRLLEICGLTQTLILDEDGLYDPCAFNDRLLLGLKGTMSEAELHILKARMRGGVLNKAQRGELHLHLPVGFLYDDEGKVILDPDQQIQGVIRLLFETYRRIGTARGVAAYFHEESILFPRHPHGHPSRKPVWKPPSTSLVRDILHNPRYAGAFAYGQCSERRQADGCIRRIKKSREEWLFLVKDTHEGYISWEEFEENQRQLEFWAQAKGVGSDRASPPREGCALLQGMVVCGICGRRMHVHYNKRSGRTTPDYVCTTEQREYGGSRCQGVTGVGVDQAVSQLLLDAVTPLTLEVALSVQEELQRRLDETDRIRRQQVERAQYEADLAQRRYMQVDPNNRLVADSLETQWNEKLLVLEKAREEYEHLCQEDRLAMDEQKRKDILALSTDFPQLWRNPEVPDRERKRMIRLVIEDVTLVAGKKDVTAHVRFKGGATRTLSVPRPRSAAEQRKTHPEVVEQIDRLLKDHMDGEVASILNERGFRSGTGMPFTGAMVCQLQRRYRLKTRYERLRASGMLTVEEVASQLHVVVGTARVWQRKGLLRRHEYTKNKYLYEPPTNVQAYEKGKHFRNRLRNSDLSKQQQRYDKEMQYEG
jgi:DNA invertase Pin-like site-specific DNA recombinase